MHMSSSRKRFLATISFLPLCAVSSGGGSFSGCQHQLFIRLSSPSMSVVCFGLSDSISRGHLPALRLPATRIILGLGLMAPSFVAPALIVCVVCRERRRQSTKDVVEHNLSSPFQTLGGKGVEG